LPVKAKQQKKVRALMRKRDASCVSFFRRKTPAGGHDYAGDAKSVSISSGARR
jgi:hypothetical protein